MTAIARLSDRGVILFSTRIPRGLHKRIRLEALERNVNLGDWIGDALRAHLRRCTEKPSATLSKQPLGGPGYAR